MSGSDLLQRPYKSRVRRPADKTDFLQMLVDEAEVFGTIRDCLAFAAALGYFRGMRKPFGASDEPIPWHIFEVYEPLINLLATATTEDPNVMEEARFGEQLTIFEEYANAGLEVMSSTVTSAKSAGDAIMELMVSAVSAPDSAARDIMAGIMSALTGA